ncbi:MAG: cob(I)yrinic acid a,c-diamide adenosyltransferase [Actinomycetota bacterium]|nr:cob(I)yrinic acid a,c-diamide adenosyltransferase [Actinomycetota bacterium]
MDETGQPESPPGVAEGQSGGAPEGQSGGAPEGRRRRKRERPLLVLNTGHGKGKSTAAFGLMLRAWNQGWRIGVFQFIKSGKWKVGEEAAARALGNIDWFKMGDGWTWTSRNLEDSAELAREGWEEAKRCLADQRYRLLLLDEFTYPLKFGWVDTSEVVRALLNRPGFQHVVITGRDAPDELVAAADLVTEMYKVKHPFDAGYRGQKGIEW